MTLREIACAILVGAVVSFVPDAEAIAREANDASPVIARAHPSQEQARAVSRLVESRSAVADSTAGVEAGEKRATAPRRESASQERSAVFLGMNLGINYLSYAGTRLSQTGVGIPGNVAELQPGLRMGLLAPNRRWSAFVDLGLLRDSGDFGSALLVQAQASIEWDATPAARTGPFLDAGLGVQHQGTRVNGEELLSATRALLGAGIGIKHQVAAGHGCLRLEARYDHLPKVESSAGDFLALDAIGARAGFDLVLGN